MAKSSKKNDFLEILMLTGFFCTVFFACFGGYFWWQKEKALEARTTASSHDKELAKLLKSQKSRDLRIQAMRIEESQRDAASLAQAIDEVLTSMGPMKPKLAEMKPNRRGSSSTGSVRAEAYTLTFESGGRLDSYVAFLQMLQTKKPHIKMSDVDLKVATRRGREASADGPEAWELKLDVVTYISDTDDKGK